MQPYYYMVYAIRRMLGSTGDARDFGEWRAVAFFLLIQVQLLMALIFIFAPEFLRQGTVTGVGLGVGIPVLIATYWILGRQERCSRYAARFDAWTTRKRAIADGGAWLFAVVAVTAPIVSRSLAG